MITWLGWIELAKSYEIGAFEGEHPVRIPVWPVWAHPGRRRGAHRACSSRSTPCAISSRDRAASELSDVEDVSTPIQ